MPRHLFSIRDLSAQDFDALTDPNLPLLPTSQPLRGTLGFLFQQPSLRTMSSFARAGAAHGLAPVALTITGDAFRDQADFVDEVRQLTLTSTCVVVRSSKPMTAAAFGPLYAPVFNAGDGSHEHPSQALLDITTMRHFGLSGATVALMGNLKDHRVQHSLALALSRQNVRVLLISPPGLELPQEYQPDAAQVVSSLDEAAVDAALSEADYVYLTPVKYWTTPHLQLSDQHTLSHKRAARVLRADAKILHPFPRFGELASDLDFTNYDAYHLQTQWGPQVRHRLLGWALENTVT